MSRFSGKQYRGAKRVLQEIKREEAEARQKAYNKSCPKTQVEIDYENNPEAQAAVERALNENPGPALPGLAKRARKITRKS